MSLTAALTSTSRRHERAFTLVEVIIAVAILSIVIGAATLMISSSSRASASTKVVDRQRAIANGALQRVLANRDWVRDFSCGLGACNISGFIGAEDTLLREPEGTIRHTLRITATGVDLPNDNDASGRDADRQVPDVYRISVTVQTQVPSTLPRPRSFTVSGTLDMAVRARSGVLRLRACQVSYQVDDRAGVGLCATGAAQTLPIGIPGGAAAYCPTSVTIAAATHECAAWRQSLAEVTPGRAAIQQMRVRPYAARFRLVGPIGGASETSRTVTTDARGSAEVAGLEPGRYELTPAPSSAVTRWDSRSVPAGGFVTIEAGEVNDAVQVFRPLARTVPVTLRRRDVSDPAAPVTRAGAVHRRSIKLVPVPNGRAALATGVDRGWTRIQPNQTRVNLRDVSPGLYQWAILEYPGAVHDIFYRTAANRALRYIWIPPATGSGAPMTMVPSSLVVEDVYCNQARRTTLYNQRITATQRALGMAPHGFLWERPGQQPVWHAPRCPAANSLTGNEQVTGSAGA